MLHDQKARKRANTKNTNIASRENEQSKVDIVYLEGNDNEHAVERLSSIKSFSSDDGVITGMETIGGQEGMDEEGQVVNKIAGVTKGDDRISRIEMTANPNIANDDFIVYSE